MTLQQVAGILGGDSTQIGLEGHWMTHASGLQIT